jgi:hypothetical protein
VEKTPEFGSSDHRDFNQVDLFGWTALVQPVALHFSENAVTCLARVDKMVTLGDIG